MSNVGIEYRIALAGGRMEVLKFALDGKTFDLRSPRIDHPPSWTELGYKQCPHCPLKARTHPHCPLALQLSDIVARFHNTRSIDRVKLAVITQERRVIQRLDLQRAIASILDLVLPTCGCPKTAYLKPLARFHLPLASEEETVFRVTGMYLLAQYFLTERDEEPRAPFAGLAEIYKDLHILNVALVNRLKLVTTSDSVKNAVALIDVYSMLVPLLLKDNLAEMRGFFEAYVPSDGVLSDTRYFEEAKSFMLDGEDAEALPPWLAPVASTIAEAGAGPAAAPPATQTEIERLLSRSNLSLVPMVPKQDQDSDEAQVG
jgi:hypothetical protein